MEKPKILCIHGIGGKDATMWKGKAWATQWRLTMPNLLLRHSWIFCEIEESRNIGVLFT